MEVFITTTAVSPLRGSGLDLSASALTWVVVIPKLLSGFHSILADGLTVERRLWNGSLRADCDSEPWSQ
jgi:hypothetical protein